MQYHVMNTAIDVMSYSRNVYTLDDNDLLRVYLYLVSTGKRKHARIVKDELIERLDPMDAVSVLFYQSLFDRLVPSK